MKQWTDMLNKGIINGVTFLVGTHLSFSWKCSECVSGARLALFQQWFVHKNKQKNKDSPIKHFISSLEERK